MVKLFRMYSNLWSHSTNVTDRRTDGQIAIKTCDCNTALCTKVHRAVKSKQRKTQQNKTIPWRSHGCGRSRLLRHTARKRSGCSIQLPTLWYGIVCESRCVYFITSWL